MIKPADDLTDFKASLVTQVILDNPVGRHTAPDGSVWELTRVLGPKIDCGGIPGRPEWEEKPQ